MGGGNLMQASQIADRLARDMERVCRHLLPQGKRDGQEWRVGSVAGEPGKSTGIHLTGEKAGIWADFAAGGGGDALDLWREVRGISLSDAMTEAASFLGVRLEPEFASGRAEPIKPMAKPKCHKPRDEVAAWLEERSISEGAIEAYRVAAKGSEVVLPYLVDGELVACKYRDIRDKSRMRVERGGAMPLFGWQAIPDNARSVVITEGEMDALACWQMGFPALSVPTGANGMGWIEVEYSRLERFDTIYLWMDADEEGQKAARKIADRLGCHRVRVVKQGVGKDANDALIMGLSAGDFIMRAQSIDPAELRSAGEFTEDVIAAFYPPDGVDVGIRPPWPKAEGKILFRPAELTLVSGINGHGKSMVTSQIAVDAMYQGSKCCIASMEMPAKRTLQRMVRQAAGMSGTNPVPSVPYIRAIQEWFADKLWLFDVHGTAKADRMIEIFEYAHRRYGIDLFIVDSLAKCGVAEDDYNGQKNLVDRLCDFKNQFGVHVMLIVHPRKGESEGASPGKMDVRGAQSITDLADNGFTLWRNKKKEAVLQKPEDLWDANDVKTADGPDAVIDWWKTRHESGWEGKVMLSYHKASDQFVDSSKARPRTYVPFSAKVTA
jgi:twinkle protein